jgi:ComF family protein
MERTGRLLSAGERDAALGNGAVERRAGRGGELARSLSDLACEHRSRRRELDRRAQRLSLRGVDWQCFGSRMPDATSWILASGWSPDEPDAFCPRCGVSVLAYEDRRGGCGACRGGPGVVGGVVRLGRYARPLSQWLPAIKRRAWRSMGDEIGRLLGKRILDLVASGRMAQPDAVVPMPVHWLRRTLRGIDHAATIASALSRTACIPVECALRAPLRWRQAGSSRAGRLANLARCEVRRGARLDGKCILIVDDVLTTGATMREAGKALQSIGAVRVFAVVGAVADPPERQVRSHHVDKF